HAACKAGVNLFCDSGNGVGWVWHHLVLEPPHRLWSTTEVSASGWASGAAIGGKLARPDRPAIAICEESGLLAGGAEIGLAVERHLGVVWLVMVARETGFTRDSIELCRFARSLGARARAIRLPGQF